MKNKFYGHLSRSNSAKNKLEEAVHKLLLSLDHIVLEIEEVPALRESISRNVKILNSQHPRCTAIITAYWKLDHEDIAFISCGDNFTYTLKKVRDFSGEVNQLIEQAKGKEVGII